MSDVDANQQVAVASGSDTDSIMSLAKRGGDMSLGGSSSPVQSTQGSEPDILVESVSSGSDANDDTILKVYIVGEDDEEKAIVFFDKYGNIADEHTTFSDFKDWNDYTNFCYQGTQLKVRLAVHDDNGETVRYIKVNYPKKALIDFGGYFCALYRVQMKESREGLVNFDDVNYKDFDRLFRVIMSGGPSSKPNLGPTYQTMRIYIEVYILADRFMMPMIKAWAAAAMEDHMRGNMHWANAYQQEFVEHPEALGAEVTHQEMLLDFNDCWVRSEYLPDDNRPVQQPRIVQFLLNYCPRALMHDMLPQLHSDLVREICTALLAV